MGHLKTNAPVKICCSATDFLNQVDFHPALNQQKKNIGRQKHVELNKNSSSPVGH